MAIYSNLSVDQGSDFSTQISVEDATGNPADLTGYIGAGEIRKTFTSSTKVDFVVIITYPTQGVVNISLPNAVTNATKPGRYMYDVEVKSPGAEITRIVEGQLEVLPGVTRSI